MRVIGAGLGRTGTISTKAALERIGFGPVLHVVDIQSDPTLLPPWEAALAGEPVDWQTALDGWNATIAWPGCTFWEQHAEVWPDALILLNVRDPEAWYRSCLATIYRSSAMAARGDLRLAPGGGLRAAGDPQDPQITRYVDWVQALLWERTFRGDFRDKRYAIDTFNRHNADVVAKAPAERLLVYDIKQGWEPLCDFLGVPVPDEPFPRLNDTHAFQTRLGMPPADPERTCSR